MKALFDPARIEHEIRNTLNRATDMGVRTSLFNLVIFCHIDCSRMIAGALEYLLGKRPARIIYIYSGHKGPSDINVTARCYPKIKDNKKICFQEIVISNGEDNIGLDPSSWSPLLIRDLPVFIWWLDSLVPIPEILLKNQEMMDKILIHSGLHVKDEPAALFRELGSSLEKGKIKVPVTDFSWEKSFPLRLWTARIFDLPEELPYLDSITRISFKGLSWNCALLYFLWLASRLGWKKGRVKGHSLTYEDNAGKSVILEYCLQCSTTYEILFTLEDGKVFRLEEEDDGHGLITSINYDRSPVMLKIQEEKELLLNQVDTISFDPLYLDVIKEAEKLEVK